jgi:hypothetical protein
LKSYVLVGLAVLFVIGGCGAQQAIHRLSTQQIRVTAGRPVTVIEPDRNFTLNAPADALPAGCVAASPVASGSAQVRDAVAITMYTPFSPYAKASLAASVRVAYNIPAQTSAQASIGYFDESSRRWIPIPTRRRGNTIVGFTRTLAHYGWWEAAPNAMSAPSDPAASVASHALSTGSPAAAGAACAQASLRDQLDIQGSLERSLYELLGTIVTSADVAVIDPRLLLAVLIRESGDDHATSWLSETPLAWVHDFSIGISNMQKPAFEEARAFANGRMNFGWTSIRTAPVNAIAAAAFLLAKLRSELSPERSSHFTDAEYLRVGYRAGETAMSMMEKTGMYPPGTQLFDQAYVLAGSILGGAGPRECA